MKKSLHLKKYLNLKNLQICLLILALFFFIKMDVSHQLQDGFQQMSAIDWGIGMLCFFGSMLFLSLRWYFLSLAFTIDLQNTWIERIVLYYRALFFNTILPGSISGDLIRGMQQTHQNWQSLAIILSERILGISVLVAMYLNWMVMKRSIHPFQNLKDLMLYFFILSVLLYLGFKILIWGSKQFFKIKITEKFIWFALIANTISHCLIILIYMHLEAQFHFKISTEQLFEILMISLLSSAIPLSVFGFGVKEMTLIALLKQFGIASELAMTYSLLFLTILMSQVCIGGILEILSKFKFISKGFKEKDPQSQSPQPQSLE
jgi:hypothetical protein